MITNQVAKWSPDQTTYRRTSKQHLLPPRETCHLSSKKVAPGDRNYINYHLVIEHSHGKRMKKDEKSKLVDYLPIETCPFR
jgi:hypothetical protein